MSFQAAAAGESILKETGKEGFVPGERDHAIADIARGQNVELAAQTARTPAIVGHCDDGRQIYRSVACFYVPFQSAEKCGQSAAPADGYDAKRGMT